MPSGGGARGLGCPPTVPPSSVEREPFTLVYVGAAPSGTVTGAADHPSMRGVHPLYAAGELVEHRRHDRGAKNDLQTVAASCIVIRAGHPVRPD